jgi:hypothetical protein
VTKTYEILAYDVWGNETDGWDVNDVFRTGLTVDIDDRHNDRHVVASAYTVLGFPTDEILGSVEVDPVCQHDTESIYLRVKETARPLMELRPVTG